MIKMNRNDNTNKPHGFQHQFKVYLEHERCAVWVITIIVIVLYQILKQVSPNAEEVHCAAALSCPDRNRSEKFLPGMFITSCSYYKISYHYPCESAINCCFR